MEKACSLKADPLGSSLSFPSRVPHQRILTPSQAPHSSKAAEATNAQVPRVKCFFPTDSSSTKSGPTRHQSGTAYTHPCTVAPTRHAGSTCKAPHLPAQESTPAFSIQGCLQDRQPKNVSGQQPHPSLRQNPPELGPFARDCSVMATQSQGQAPLENTAGRQEGGNSRLPMGSDTGAGRGLSSSRDGGGHSSCLKGLAVAAQFVRNDAAFMKRGLQSLDSRARRDVERLRTGVTYLDARARADADKLNSSAWHRLRRLRSFALGMEEAAKMELEQAAEQHRNANGALIADLQIADVRARRRALEDAYLAWQTTRQVHDSIVKVLRAGEGLDMATEAMDKSIEEEWAELRSRPLDPMEVWYSSATVMAVLGLREGEAEERSSSSIGSSEELEFLLAALLDLDEVSEGSGALLLAQQIESPDVSTRQAIVNVLAAAPSLWALGNAGIGALQRLSRDESPAVAAAASEALSRLWSQFTQEQDQ